MNRCFGNSAYASAVILIKSFSPIFPDQTIMAQSGNGAEFESDVISLGTGQELNFGDDTLKGKDSYNCQ